MPSPSRQTRTKRQDKAPTHGNAKAFEQAATASKAKQQPDIPLNELPQTTQEAFSRHILEISSLVDDLETHIESVKIDDTIEQHFLKSTNSPFPDDTSDLNKLILSHNAAFAINESIDENQRIEGNPGSQLITAFFIEKAMGRAVTAQTLKKELEQFGVYRTIETCETVELLAGHYIRNHITPKQHSGSLPDTKIPENNIK